jgi:hypothetical protein
MTMDTGHKLGLILLYVVMAGFALLMLRIFVQMIFRDAIERNRRRQFTEKNSGAYTVRAFDGKRGWANTWLPRNPEINQPAQNGISAGKRTGTAPIVKQAIALVSMVIAFGLVGTVAAQESSARSTSASTLKQELLDIELKETRLRMRLEELDEQLKPESTERALAGFGSTHSEELREHRRKLLTIERSGLQEQLDLLEEERARVEAATAAKENEVYLRYALPSGTPPFPQPQMQMTIANSRIASLPIDKLFAAFAISVPLAGGLILILIVARQKFTTAIAKKVRTSSGFQTADNTSFEPLPTSALTLKATQRVQS